ncbi:MAG: hypothetical protein ABJC13_07635 [Acidobacteriota bacterium]
MKHQTIRVVAIDPTTRGFAYAVLEGSEDLIDWGLVHVLLRTDAKILSRAEQLFDRCLPDLLVLEDGRGTRRRTRACHLIKDIEDLAKHRGLPVVRVSRARVRDVLKPAVTKQEIAEAISRVFPELAPRLPRFRKPWMSEDERMNIFDAVSLALAALSK